MQNFPLPSANIHQASVVAVHLEQKLQWLWEERSVSQSCLTTYAKQSTHLSLLVDRCINHKNCTADKPKKPFFFIISLLEQIIEHFIHLFS